MKQLMAALLLFTSFNAFAGGHHDGKSVATKDDEIISQPADCYAKQTLPCTIKSITRHKSAINQTSFVFLKNAVVKITDFANLNLEPVVGGFVVLGTNSSVRVKDVPLTKFPSYADITKGQIEVIDGKDFYVFKFSDGETERYLLDREPFIKKLAGFYNSVDALKAEYKNISPIYNKSFKQDVAVHKQILSRRIASVEEQKKQEAERARRIREQQRKNKETFFKRTFVQ